MASIRIDDITAKRLANFKERKSYTTIIDEMISFFENTGMRVTDNVASPIIVVQQESAKLQKIMRAIESKQNVLLKDILDRSNFLVNVSQEVVAGVSDIDSSAQDDENYMHVKEVQEMMSAYKKLEAELKKSREENSRLIQERDDAKIKSSKMTVSPTSAINKKIISECLDKLIEKKSSPMFDTEKYTIRKSDFNMCIDTIREELKK